MQEGDGDEPWDTVVVGGGPAGLSAATWLGRYRRRTLVIDAGEHRNRAVDRTHGYLTRDGASPAELLETACRDLDEYPVIERRDGDVVAIHGGEGMFRVVTSDDQVLRCLRVVLATGVIDALPDLAGVDDHYGTSLFHCPSCDGFEAEGRNVVVLGWSEHVAGFALELLDWASNVTVVTDGRRFEGDERQVAALGRYGIDLIEEDAVALLGSPGDLRAVRLRDGRQLDCEMAFFSIGHQPRNQLGAALHCRRTPEGYFAVDEHGQTSVPGVFAAGDVTPGYQLIQVAAAKGAAAGVGAALSLRREPPLPNGPGRAPDVGAELGEGV